LAAKQMNEEIQKYIRCMEEIKLRDQVIESHLTGERFTGQPMTNIEFICLQFRKIGELIMLSALCAHKTEYQKIHSSIGKDGTRVRFEGPWRGFTRLLSSSF
jgi:hypothetical protein